MAKKQKAVQLDVAGQGAPVLGWGGGTEHVLFIDSAAEISDAKIKRLEEAGFIVVPLVGAPAQCVFQVVRYK